MRARYAWLASLLAVLERAGVRLALLDPTRPPVAQPLVHCAPQDTIAKVAPAKLDVLCTARHQRLRTTSLDASAMQATADRAEETAAFVLPVPFALERQTALDLL